MTKLPLLAGAFMISTILSPIGAIDVNIPGADSKIPKDVYINYQATSPDIEKDVANYVEALKLTDKANGIIQLSPFTTITTKFGFHSL